MKAEYTDLAGCTTGIVPGVDPGLVSINVEKSAVAVGDHDHSQALREPDERRHRVDSGEHRKKRSGTTIIP